MNNAVFETILIKCNTLNGYILTVSGDLHTLRGLGHADLVAQVTPQSPVSCHSREHPLVDQDNMIGDITHSYLKYDHEVML